MMRRLWWFWRLPASSRRSVVAASCLLVAATLGLRVVSFPTLRRVLRGVLRWRPRGKKGRSVSVDEVVWAVGVAARHLPLRQTCLTRALAAQVLLGWGGIPSRLHIGVNKAESGRLEAHAWVESRGEVVVGGVGEGRFVPLTSFEDDTG